MKYLVTPLLLLLATVAFAQPGREGKRQDKEKVAKLKIAFLTEELDLSIEESQQFWPVYNAYNKTREASENVIRTTMDGLEKGTLTDKSVQEAIDTVTLEKQNRAAAEAQFLKDAMAILGPEKTVKLMHAEHRFKRELARRMNARVDRQSPPREVRRR